MEHGDLEVLASQLLDGGDVDDVPGRLNLEVRYVTGAELQGHDAARDGRVILVRASLPEIERRFGVAHECLEWVLRNLRDPDIEALCNAGAACLVAPARMVRRLYRVPGDVVTIARVCRCTETCAALRVGEVCEPVAVVAPKIVRARNPEPWVWPDKATLRDVAEGRRHMPGLAKVHLTDAPRRIALIA